MMALLLAFGLALAMGRYETRRAAMVEETNTIGTTYLRAQTLAEPARTASLDLLGTTPTRPSRSRMPCRGAPTRRRRSRRGS